MSKADAMADAGKTAVLQNIHGTMEFLQKFPPFNQMDTAHLAFLVEHCQLRFYAEGDSIIKPADGVVEHFYIVKQGRVHGERPHSARRGTETTFEEVLAAMQERDARDSSRAHAPLKPAEDAIVVDSTEMSQPQVVARIAGLARGD